MKRFFCVTGFTGFATLICVGILFRLFDIMDVFIAAFVFAASMGVLAVVFFCRKSMLWQNCITIGISAVLFASSFMLCYDNYIFRSSAVKPQTLTADFYVEKIDVSKTGLYNIYTVSTPNGEIDGNLKLFSRNTVNCECYDVISATVKIKGNPGDDEYLPQNMCDNIVQTGFISGNAEMVASPKSFQKGLLWLRNYFSSAYDYTLSESSSLAKALVLGDKSALSAAEYSVLKTAGLSHIAAVSGLHVAILAGFIVFFLKKMSRRWLSFSILTVILSIFAGICGFSPSVIRAGLMFLFAYGASLLFEKNDSLNTLGLLMTVFLATSPFLIFSPSFLLSYAATAGILIFTSPMSRAFTTFYFRISGKMPGRLINAVAVALSICLSCYITTSPLTVFFFGSASTVSIISNLICIPLVNIIFILLLITLLLALSGFCLPAATFVGAVARFFIKIFLWTAEKIGSFFTRFLTVNMLILVIAFAVAGIVAALICVLYKNKKIFRRFLLCTVPLLVIVIVSDIGSCSSYLLRERYIIPDNSTCISVVDVEQGNCGAVVCDGKATVFDCGGGYDAGERLVAFLEKCDVISLDTVVVSHLHSDHYNGIDALFARYEVKRIIISNLCENDSYFEELSQKSDEEGAELVLLEQDLNFSVGSANIEILTRQIDPLAKDANENSLVGIVHSNGFSFLFSGDMTTKTESRLVESYGSRLNIDIYNVAHNGSKTSSSEEFLNEATPVFNVISVGADNSYGHPADKTVERLEKYGAVFRTDEYGTLRFMMEKDGIDVYSG